MPMSTAHPLRDIERINGPPGPYLEAIGTVFATFGAPAQDSGNVSYGVQVGGERFFVKTIAPEVEAFCDHETRGALLYNAARLRRSCDHPTLPALHRIVETAHGPALVYDWVDGECLYGGRDDPQSAHQRFRRLPTDTILAVLDAIYDLHVRLVQRGWIAVDFYDGSLMYDFERRAVHVVDLDNYHLGAFTNQMGRMFGSTRFMAPEEFERGALIDERTTVFTMGRTAVVCLGDDIGGALGEVVRRACRQEREARYSSMEEFYAAWQQARQLGRS